MSTAVSASLQLEFISQIQGRLMDSKAVTTYKYALLHAIADLCVLKYQGDPSQELQITKGELAKSWLSLYDGHLRPYTLQDGTTIELVQRTKSVPNATALRLIDEYICLHSAEQSIKQAELIKRLKHTLENPITRLYAGLSPRDNFLYRYASSTLTLKPGIAYCFREHHALVTRLIRERWLSFVRANNAHVLTERQELSGFLFGVERRSLAPYREALKAVGEALCFYCGASQDPLAVDHFIPWSVYAADFGHNFVLACTPCNSSKSDHLPSLSYLREWVTRNERSGEALAQECEERGLAQSLSSSHSIAEWAYSRHIRLGGELWVKSRSFKEASLEGLSAVLP